MSPFKDIKSDIKIAIFFYAIPFLVYFSDSKMKLDVFY